MMERFHLGTSLTAIVAACFHCHRKIVCAAECRDKKRYKKRFHVFYFMNQISTLKIGIPVHAIAMMMSIALRFIPILIEETDKIMKAQMARRRFDLCPNCTKALEIMLSHKIRCRLLHFVHIQFVMIKISVQSAVRHTESTV